MKASRIYCISVGSRVVLADGLSDVVDMDIDWVSRNLYWIDGTKVRRMPQIIYLFIYLHIMLRNHLVKTR